MTLTWCDTTSSFFGIGKKSMLKALKETPNQFSDLSRIEYSDIDNSVDLSRKLISGLYGPKGKLKRCHIDLNKLRVKLATVKESTLVRLPPSEDTFKQSRSLFYGSKYESLTLKNPIPIQKRSFRRQFWFNNLI